MFVLVTLLGLNCAFSAYSLWRIHDLVQFQKEHLRTVQGLLYRIISNSAEVSNTNNQKYPHSHEE